MRHTKTPTRRPVQKRQGPQTRNTRQRHQPEYEREYEREYEPEYDEDLENYFEEEFERQYREGYERDYNTPEANRRRNYEPAYMGNYGPQRERSRRPEYDQDYERRSRYSDYNDYEDRYEEDPYFHEFENAFEDEMMERSRYSPRRNSLQDEGYADYDDYISDYNQDYEDESFRPGRRRHREEQEHRISYERYPRIGSYGTDRGYDRPMRRRSPHPGELRENFSNGMDMGVTRRRSPYPSHNQRNLRSDSRYSRHENRSNKRRGTQRSSSI